MSMMQIQSRLFARPSEISYTTVWSPITYERKLDDGQAIYRGADRRFPARG